MRPVSVWNCRLLFLLDMVAKVYYGGDPNQLPPTVLSQAAASYNYEQSLFVRMQKNHPDSVYMLDVQYRMHPMISKFPSSEFYNSKLKDGDGMLELNTRPWHKDPPLTPYRFLIFWVNTRK